MAVSGPRLSGEDQGTSFDITATPVLITNNSVRCPAGTVGIQGKVHNVKPPFVFVNQGTVSGNDQLEADPAFGASLDSGNFAAECQSFVTTSNSGVAWAPEIRPGESSRPRRMSEGLSR